MMKSEVLLTVKVQIQDRVPVIGRLPSQIRKSACGGCLQKLGSSLAHAGMV